MNCPSTYYYIDTLFKLQNITIVSIGKRVKERSDPIYSCVTLTSTFTSDHIPNDRQSF